MQEAKFFQGSVSLSESLSIFCFDPDSDSDGNNWGYMQLPSRCRLSKKSPLVKVKFISPGGNVPV